MKTSEKMQKAFSSFAEGVNPTTLAEKNEWISYPTAVKYFKLYNIKKIIEVCNILLLTQRFDEPGYFLNSPDFEKILKILEKGTWNIEKRNFEVRQ